MRKMFLTALLMIAPLALTAIQPTAAAETPATKTVTLTVENMTCAACPITVRKALRKVPGVATASADYTTKTATVTFDPAKTRVEALIKATTDAGYPSRLKH